MSEAHHSWKNRFMNGDMGFDMSTVNDYVKKTIEESLTGVLEDGHMIPKKDSPASSGGTLAYSIFEIIGCIIVQFTLPPKIDYHDVHLYVEHRELVVKLEGHGEETILLPKKVLAESSKAYYQDHLIEIRLPLDTEHSQTEIPIKPV